LRRLVLVVTGAVSRFRGRELKQKIWLDQELAISEEACTAAIPNWLGTEIGECKPPQR
jgi:hypothetical protein